MLGVLGIPYELIRGEGTSQREAYRRFLHSTLKPIGKIIEYEFRMKTGLEIKIDYTNLQGSDIAGRARAFGILTKNGLSQDTALKIIGIDKDSM